MEGRMEEQGNGLSSKTQPELISILVYLTRHCLCRNEWGGRQISVSNKFTGYVMNWLRMVLRPKNSAARSIIFLCLADVCSASHDTGVASLAICPAPAQT